MSEHVKGERRRRPFWVGRPSVSAEPIWALLGLVFGLRALVGLMVASPGAPTNLRSEGSGKEEWGFLGI
jgi:hypothetical protein